MRYYNRGVWCDPGLRSESLWSQGLAVLRSCGHAVMRVVPWCGLRLKGQSVIK